MYAFVRSIKSGEYDVVNGMIRNQNVDLGLGLYGAVEAEQHKIAKLLIDAGADVNYYMIEQNPMVIAIRNEDVEMIALLLASDGIDVEFEGTDGRNLLTYAYLDENSEIINMLKEAGAPEPHDED